MSFSDFGSDLTDLSSSEGDLDYKPPTQKNKKKTPKTKSTKKQQGIEGALRPPRTTQYTTRSLYEQMVEGSIDLDPEYQRDVVWPDTKQIGLIDSIFRNFYIPPVIFSVMVGKDGSENRVCIDGKQRLTSLQKFMDGLIPYKDYATGKKYWYKQVGSTRGRTPLAKHLQQIFCNKQIVCMEYDGLNDDQEREMFQRVQLGVALTPAERMQAITGPWPTFIRTLRDQTGPDVFNDLSDFGKTRGRDFQAIVSVVFMIDKMPTLTTPAAPALEKWLQQTTTPPQKLRDDVHNTFQILVHMVQDPKLKTPFMKPTRISPVEFVMVGLLIYKHRHELSFAQLSSAIGKIRANVREVEKDIRTNTRVTRLLFSSIKKLNTTNLKSDGKGDKPAALAVGTIAPAVSSKNISASAGPSKNASASAGPSKNNSAPAGPSKKRKRVVESSSSDDEDADLRPPPPKTGSKTRMTMNSRAARLVDMEPPKPKWTGKPKTTATSSAANGTKTSGGASSPKTVKSPVMPSKPSTSSVAKSATSAKKPAPSAVNQARNTQTARPSKPLPPPVNTQVPAATSSKSAMTPRNRRQIQSPISPPESAQSASIPSPIVPPPAAVAPPKVPKLERNPTTPTVPAEPPVFIKQEAEPISLSNLPPKPSGPSRLAALRAAKAAKAVGGSQTCSPAAGSSNMGVPRAPMAAQSIPMQSAVQPTQMPMQSPVQSYQNQPATPSVLPPNLSRKPSPPRAPAPSTQSWQPPPPPPWPMVGVQPTSPAYTQMPSSSVNPGFLQPGQLPQGQIVSPQITMTPQNLNELLRAVGASTQSVPTFNPPNQAFSQNQGFNGQQQTSQPPVNGMQFGNHVGTMPSPVANGSYSQFASPRYAGNSAAGHQSFGPTAPSSAANGSHSQFASPAYAGNSVCGNQSFGPMTPSMSNGSFAPMTPAGSNGLPPRPPFAPTSDPRLSHRTSTADVMRPPPIATAPGSTSPGRLRRMSTETAPLPQSASPMSSFSDAHRERSESGRYEERGRGREKYERDREWDRERDREYEHGRGYSRGRGYDYQGRSSSRGSYHHGGHYRERDRYEESSRPYDREKDLDRYSSRGSREDWYEKGKGRDERSRDSGRYGRGQTPEVERERDGVWGRRESGGGSGTIDEFGRST